MKDVIKQRIEVGCSKYFCAASKIPSRLMRVVKKEKIKRMICGNFAFHPPRITIITIGLCFQCCNDGSIRAAKVGFNLHGTSDCK